MQGEKDYGEIPREGRETVRTQRERERARRERERVRERKHGGRALHLIVGPWTLEQAERCSTDAAR